MAKRRPKPMLEVNAKTRRIIQDAAKQAVHVSTLKGIHTLRRQLKEVAFYPEHDKRKASPEYRKVHDRLVKKENRACIVCGVTDSVLRSKRKSADPKVNPFGATQMETHHRVIEWALANAVDLARFNQRVYPGLKRRNPAKYARPFTQQRLLDWVDHDPDNLWVLCNVHHRGPYVGIHEITDPIWGPQDLFKPAFIEAAEQLVETGGKAAPRTRRARRARKKRARA